MATLLQVICLIHLLVMVHGWGFSSFDEPFPSTYFNDHFDDDSFSTSTFDDDFDEIMATMRQQFRQMSAFSSSLSKAHDADMMEAKKKLNAVTPNCTTTTHSPTTTYSPTTADSPATTNSPPTTSIQNNRRKQFRTTQTTTCVKELFIDGKKLMSKEIKVTDDKGIIISQSNDYQSFTINTISNTTASDINE